MGDDRIVKPEKLPARADGDGNTKLGAEQQTALESLMSGKSVAETARTVGVTRMTLYRWLKNDPMFRAAYNEWRESLKESCRARLLAMTDKAADVVEKALQSGDAKWAMDLLKGMGLVAVTPAESTDADVLKREAELAKDRKESELRTREMFSGRGRSGFGMMPP
jgi:transposase-like protein